MLLRPISLATAGLLASVQAFLLPPEVSPADLDSGSKLSVDIDTLLTTDAISIDLACPGCPLYQLGPKGVITTIRDPGSTHLELVFAVEHAADADRLTINGFPIYPSADPFSRTLTAPHLRDDDEASFAHEAGNTNLGLNPELGFSLHVRPEFRDEQGQIDLVALDFQIIQVGASFVDGMPQVHVKLVETPSGALMIGSIEAADSQTLKQSTPMEIQEECTSFVCKWRAIVQAKLASLRKHCHGHKHATSHAISDDNDQAVPPPQQRPHYRYGNEHSWARLFKRIASHILLPILVGIVAGVTASFLGMLVGTLLVAGWRKMTGYRPSRRPRRRSTHSRRKSTSMREGHEVSPTDEKASLVQHQEGPPAYVDEVLRPTEV